MGNDENKAAQGRARAQNYRDRQRALGRTERSYHATAEEHVYLRSKLAEYRESGK